MTYNPNAPKKYRQSIANNQTSPANIDNVLLDSTKTKSANIQYYIDRTYNQYNFTNNNLITENAAMPILTSGSGQITSNFLQSDGKLIVGLNSAPWTGGTRRGSVTRFNTDMSVDGTFTENQNTWFPALASTSKVIQLSDGKILISHNTTISNECSFLTCFNSDGTLATTFNTNASSGRKFNSAPIALKEQSDGKILVGGSFADYGGNVGASYLIRLNSDGTLDTSFSGDGISNSITRNGTTANFNGVVRNINIRPDGRVTIIGGFTNYAGVTGTNYVIGLTSSYALDTSFNSSVSDSSKFTGGTSFLGLASDSSNGLYISGNFTQWNGQNGTSKLVKFDSSNNLDTTWKANATDGVAYTGNNKFDQLTTSITSLAVDSSGNLWATGAAVNYNAITGSSYVWKFDSAGVFDSTFDSTVVRNTSTPRFQISSSPQLDIIGNYIMISIAAHTDASAITRYRALFLDTTGALYANYNNMVCGRPANSFSAVPTTAAIKSDGKILLGGSFLNHNQVTGRSYLLALNSDLSLNTSFNSTFVDSSKFNAAINKIIVDANDNIYIIGSFTNYNGSGKNYFLKINAIDDSISYLATNLPSAITNMSLLSDGSFFLQGSNYMYRYNSDLTEDTAYYFKVLYKFSSHSFITCTENNNGDLFFYGNFNFSEAASVTFNNFVAVSSSGETFVDMSFRVTYSNRLGSSAIGGVVVLPDNSFIIAGNHTVYNTYAPLGFLTKFNPSGEVDSDFTEKVSGTPVITAALGSVYTVFLYNNKIVLGSNTTTYQGVNGRNYFIVLNLDGSVDENSTNKISAVNKRNNLFPAFCRCFIKNNMLVAPFNSTSSPYLNKNGPTQSVAFIQLALEDIPFIESGSLELKYNQTTSEWELSTPSKSGNSGVLFSVTPLGQLQYTSTNLTGTLITSNIEYTISKV